jgi:two-component system CheB/CheR fusion protein
MTGYDLARRVRRDGNGTATRLVALSGYGKDEDITAAMDAGFDAHLTKPTDFDRIEQLIRGSRGADEQRK